MRRLCLFLAILIILLLGPVAYVHTVAVVEPTFVTANTTPAWVNTYVFDSKPLTQPVSVILRVKEGARVSVKNSSIHIGVIDMSNSVVVVNITSSFQQNITFQTSINGSKGGINITFTPIQKSITENKTQEYDFDLDGKNDIYVTVNSISGLRANISIGLVTPPVVPSPKPNLTVVNVTQPNTSAVPNLTNTSVAPVVAPKTEPVPVSSPSAPNNLWMYMLGGIILIVVIVVLIAVFKGKKEEVSVAPAVPKVVKPLALLSDGMTEKINGWLSSGFTYDIIKYKLVEAGMLHEEAGNVVHYHRLDLYVKTAFAQGETSADIHKKLADIGWPNHILEQIFVK